MKTLILFRHGESAHGAGTGRDRDRPLTGRGQREARTMGRFLQRVGQVPDRVLSSPAVRARTTAKVAAKAGGWGPEVEIEESIYGSSVTGLLALLRDLPDGNGSVLLVGHEPAFSALAGQLIGSGIVQVRTAAMVCVELDVDSWSRLEPGRGRLAWAVPPELVTGNETDLAG